jgi:hypothetical protein
MSDRKFQAYCSSCGCDRGLKPKIRLDILCNKCGRTKAAKSRLMTKDLALDKLAKREDGVVLISEWLGASKPATFYDPKYGEWTVKNAGRVVTGKHSHPKRGIEIIVQKVTGKRHSEETKAKLAKISTGNTHSIGKKRSIDQVIKNSAIQQGISVDEWRGFSTKESEIARGSFKKQGLHYTCFIRDDFTCQKCNTKGGNLNAHHLNSWKFFPEQRYSLDNLVTLCTTCHKAFHDTYGNGHKQSNTVQQYLEFKEKYK